MLVASKSGLEAIRAKITVDCSADADIAARAGVPFHKGREGDGLTQPMTLFFRVGNVDDDEGHRVRHRMNEYRPFTSIVKAAHERGEFPIPREAIGDLPHATPGHLARQHHPPAAARRHGRPGSDEGRDRGSAAGDVPDEVLPRAVPRLRERDAAGHGRDDRRPRDAADRRRVHADRRRPGDRPRVRRRDRAVRLPDRHPQPDRLRRHDEQRGVRVRERLPDPVRLPGAARGRPAAGGGPLRLGQPTRRWGRSG